MDTLADALVNVKNAEMAGKGECMIRPASRMVRSILKIMQSEGYIGNFELIDDGKAGVYKVQLTGSINNCKAIKPRYSVKRGDMVRWEHRDLPARGLGILIMSTPKGIMTHKEAEQMQTGGKLVAYVY